MSERERAATERDVTARVEHEQPLDERPGADMRYDDPEVELPGEDDYVVPGADVGEANRGQGTDRMGGYGNRAIPREPGPSQDD